MRSLRRAPAEATTDVVADAARVLRDGVAAHRGRPVERLTATLVVGGDHRLAGLSGNADGEAPVPTPETFEQLNAVLARLGRLPEDAGADESPTGADGTDRPDGPDGPTRRFTVRVEGESGACRGDRRARSDSDHPA